ncbi:MAG: hypothetical protein IPO48_13475 [Saprospiraceae bacterium]|nr:hypothetical protein [Saprospiraceae bacterium]
MTSIGSTLKIFNTACDFISYIGYDYYNSVQRAYYNNFTIGNEYKFYVNNGFPTEGDYQICITETVPNDECTSGTIIPTASFNTTCNCDVMVSGSCVGATPSNISPYMWHDVWYSFVATTATMTFALSPKNGSSSVTGIVYSDCSIYLGFIGSSGLTLNNLVIGNEYSIRIKANNSDGNPGDFEMCIRSLTNDYCDNPVTLTPQPGTSCSPTSGSNIGATPSNNTYCILPDKKDVWFQFTATATTHLIKVVSTTAGFYPSFFVFRKKTAASSCDMNCIQSSVDCTNFADTIDFIPNVAILNSLTIGATYLISVTNVFQDSITGNFNICVLTPGTTMNVWSTKAETYSTTETAKVGGYQFPMKRITLNMTGTTSPLIVTQVVVNTSGTTNTSDLRAAKLYYAGNQGSMSTFKSFKRCGRIRSHFIWGCYY